MDQTARSSLSSLLTALVVAFLLTLTGGAGLLTEFATAAVPTELEPLVIVADDDDKKGEKKKKSKKGKEEKKDDSDDEDDDKADKKKKKEIPPPPKDNFVLPDGVDAEVKKRYEAAIALYDTAKEKYPREAPRKEALKAFKKLQRKMGDTSCLPGYYIGILLQWDREYSKARREMKKVVKKQPDFYEAYVELGDIEYQDKRNKAAAVDLYKQALDIYPHYEYGVDRLLMTLCEMGRYKEAEPFLERALEFGGSPLRMRCKRSIDFAVKGPGWGQEYVTESENYIVRTDISQEMADDISENMELVRELYDAVFPDISKQDRKYLILFFGDKAGYVRAGAPGNSLGVYDPLSKQIMLYLNDGGLSATLITLKHEGFHQYCNEYLDRIPTWFNEGLADYFSASELVKRGKTRVMKIRPAKRRMDYLIRVLNHDISRPSLSELMNMTHAQMYDMRNKNRNQYMHYCQAWATCYFCIEGGNRRYTKALKEYFKAIRKGKTQREAYDVTFGRIDMVKFENEWESFVQRTYNTDRGI